MQNTQTHTHTLQKDKKLLRKFLGDGSLCFTCHSFLFRFPLRFFFVFCMRHFSLWATCAALRLRRIVCLRVRVGE